MSRSPISPLLKSILTDDGFQSDTFKCWQPLYYRLFASRWTAIGLLCLGIARVIFFLLAYAPADGADAMTYYAYAAYMNGADLPSEVAKVSPLFPLLVYVNHYLLGNFNLIILWQMVMSASLGLLYYLGLRPYNALLGFLVALLVIGDAQTGVSFNLTSTEPLYVFLLTCIYALFLIQHQSTSKKSLQIRDVLLGVLIVLLRETRTVARYIIVPVSILFALATRSWRRVLVVLVSYLLMVVLFNVSTHVIQVAQQSSLNDTMVLRPLLTYGLLDAEAGEASAELTVSITHCRNDGTSRQLTTCLDSYYGGRDAALAIINQAYIESVTERPFAIYRRMFEEFTAFLQLNARQVHGTPTPADVQCKDIPSRVQRQIEQTISVTWDGLNVPVSQQETYAAVIADFAKQMCPPAPTNATIHDLTDTLAQRYRSLSRPHPYRWYLTLTALVLLIPFGRKLWLPVFFAGGLLVYHAAVSAAVFNVQERYVMVTNPFKGILILSTVLIIGHVMLKLLDIRLTHYEH